jgi:drug/metabolite transporter (DMT)-like permease
MAPPGSHPSGPLRAGIRPRLPHCAAKSEVPPQAISFWWLWPVATGTAAAMMRALAEQQLQRGVPTMLGAIGGLIIGGVEAALITRRSRGRHPGWRRLIWLALATMVCLALAPVSDCAGRPRLCHRLLHLSTMGERLKGA